MEKLQGLRVVSFESRRSIEMAELIRKQGGEPISAPSMQEVGCADDAAAVAFGRELLAGQIQVVVFFTGVGFRHLFQTFEKQFTADEIERIRAALGAVTTVARGPKPVAAMREQGLQPTVTVPSPNTWRETLVAMDANLSLAGKRVSVLEYGESNEPFLAALRERGAIPDPVQVYRWALPDDLAPLRNAIRAIIAGEVDVALFTSSAQVDHLVKVAKQEGADAPLLEALKSRVAVFSIGPVCSETLREFGILVDGEPQNPKMGPLILAAAEQARGLVEKKRLTPS